LASTKNLFIKRLSSTQSTSQNETTTATSTAETKTEIPPESETNQQKESPNVEKKPDTEHQFATSKAFRM